jgi:hypothetical protein
MMRTSNRRSRMIPTHNLDYPRQLRRYCLFDMTVYGVAWELEAVEGNY